ncbi:MAG: tetratricopeptide repeat protein [Magnetococcales bacterium]|nr:tetratricopeptide repeat protein [Magnetococcales bacterium]
MRHVYHLSGWVIMAVGVLATIVAAALSIFPSVSQGLNFNDVIISGIITAILGGILARLSIPQRNEITAAKPDLSQFKAKGIPFAAATVAVAATIWPLLVAQNQALQLNTEHVHKPRAVVDGETVGQITAKKHSANIQKLLNELSLKLEKNRSKADKQNALRLAPQKKAAKDIRKIQQRGVPKVRNNKRVAKKTDTKRDINDPQTQLAYNSQSKTPGIDPPEESQQQPDPETPPPELEPEPEPGPEPEPDPVPGPIADNEDSPEPPSEYEVVPDPTTTISNTAIFTNPKIEDEVVAKIQEALETSKITQAENDLVVIVNEKQVTTGNSSLAIASAKHNYASALAIKGDLAQASKLLEESIKIKKIHLPESDPSLGNSYQNLASVYKLQGKYPQAISLQNDAISNQITNLGENDPRVAISYNDLARLYERSNSFVEAKYYFERSLSILLNSPTPNNPYVSVARSNYASLLKKLNLTDASEKQLELLRILHNGMQSVDVAQQ